MSFSVALCSFFVCIFCFNFLLAFAPTGRKLGALGGGVFVVGVDWGKKDTKEN